MNPIARKIFLGFGISIILIGVGALLVTLLPTLQAELSYNLHRSNPNAVVATDSAAPKDTVKPIDPAFGIVIPKIAANAHITPNVDPFNVQEYEQALSKGVAQAKGTALPGQAGNMFLFSHSAADPWFATHYNSIFYLLSKLSVGDKFYVFYNSKPYEYEVTGTKIIDPTEVHYLMDKTYEKTVTLMTCWPAGVNYKRLLVFGKEVS